MSYAQSNQYRPYESVGLNFFFSSDSKQLKIQGNTGLPGMELPGMELPGMELPGGKNM